MWNFRSRTPPRSRKNTVALKNRKSNAWPGTVGGGSLSNGYRKCAIGYALSLPVCTLFSKTRRFLKKLEGNCRLRTKNMGGLFLKSPRFLTPRSSLGNRLQIEIYPDAFARAPFGKESINWEAGSDWDWRNSSHKRYRRRIPPARSERKIHPWINGSNSPNRTNYFL